MRRRREYEIFSMSFLDAICCGFGAMILLFLVIRVGEPDRLEESMRDLDGLIAQYEQELNEIVGETERVRRQELTTTQNLRTDSTRIEDLQALQSFGSRVEGAIVGKALYDGKLDYREALVALSQG